MKRPAAAPPRRAKRAKQMAEGAFFVGLEGVFIVLTGLCTVSVHENLPRTLVLYMHIYIHIYTHDISLVGPKEQAIAEIRGCRGSGVVLECKVSGVRSFRS